jgi:hypothetical protein
MYLLCLPALTSTMATGATVRISGNQTAGGVGQAAASDKLTVNKITVISTNKKRKLQLVLLQVHPLLLRVRCMN